jgi:hypothetical protein
MGYCILQSRDPTVTVHHDDLRAAFLVVNASRGWSRSEEVIRDYRGKAIRRQIPGILP